MEEISRINLVQIVMATIQTNKDKKIRIRFVMATIQTDKKSERAGPRDRKNLFGRRFGYPNRADGNEWEFTATMGKN